MTSPLPGRVLFSAQLALTVLLGFAHIAAAQAPLGLATQAQADGFRVGDKTRIHVFGNVDLRFDSNPVLLPVDPVGDMVLRVRAGMALSRPSERLELSLKSHADWSQYLGVLNVNTRSLSTLQGLIDFGLLANKEGRVTFFVNDNLTRNDIPANAAINQRLRSTRNVLHLGTDVRPWAGRALELRVAYSNDFNFYDPGQISVQDANALTFMTHVADLRALWRFFPKTALVLEAQGAITHYPLAGITIRSPQLNALRVMAGMQGLVTPKLTVVAKAGYGNTFAVYPIAVASNPNFSSLIALASLSWKPLESTTLGLGYQRDFTPVAIYGWLQFDRAFVEFQQIFANRFIAALRGHYQLQQFGLPVIAGLAADRRDHVFGGEARFTVQFKQWLSASAFYVADLRLTPFLSPNGVGGQYIRHIGGLDLTVGY